MVARFVRDEEVAGSNPVTPTRSGIPCHRIVGINRKARKTVVSRNHGMEHCCSDAQHRFPWRTGGGAVGEHLTIDLRLMRATGAGLGRIKDALQHAEATKPSPSGGASPGVEAS